MTWQKLKNGPRCEAGKNPHILDEQSLILTTDRDPLDVQLRRTRALLASLAPANPKDRDLRAQQLNQIAERAEALRKSADEPHSRDLYLELRQFTRTIAFANPLLDFDNILFMAYIKPGGDFHMVDQYVGWNARPGGGIFILRHFKGDPHRRRTCCENSVVETAPSREPGCRAGRSCGPTCRLTPKDRLRLEQHHRQGAITYSRSMPMARDSPGSPTAASIAAAPGS